jgi:hypothetical protein
MRPGLGQSAWQATAATALLLVSGSTAAGQFRAGIQGTVKDSSGGILPGVTITIVQKETDRQVETVTTGEGFYSISGLAPGLYTLSAALNGFKTAVADNVVVSAEETRSVNLTLEPGGIAETVTVTAPATMETTTPNVGGAITTEEIQRLPEFGRDPYELLRTAPGIFGESGRNGTGGVVGLPNTSGPGGSNFSVFQTENQVPITANGQRLSANNFMVDGVSVNSLNWGGGAVLTPNIESIKEIQVLSSTYSAEDGRNSGAQVKVVSQAGTNARHGSAVFKYNDPDLNALNKYGGPNNAPRKKIQDRLRQYAGSFGGPIRRGSLFFFGSYEGLRSSADNPVDTWIETPEFRQLVGQLYPNGISSRVMSSAGMQPRVIAQLTATCAMFSADPSRCRQVPGGLDIGSPTGRLGQYVDSPIGGGFDGIPDIQFVRLSVPTVQEGDQYNARIDYQRGGRDQVALITYFTKRRDHNAEAAGKSRPSADLQFRPLNSAVTVTHNHTFSERSLNEARFNVTGFSADQVSDSSGTNFGIPRVEVEQFLPAGDRIRFGANRSETTPAVFSQYTYELRDIFTHVHGGHALKVGGEYRWERDHSNKLGGARPNYSFVGLFNLANDAPLFEAINADPATGAPSAASRPFDMTALGLFVQDDWRLRPTLTLNAGLRYEYFAPPGDSRGSLSNIFFGSGDQRLTGATIRTVDQLFEPDRDNFAPRIGFTWTPDRFAQKVVWRGGFGVSYNRIPNVVFSNARGNPPGFARYSINGGNSAHPFADGQILYALGSGSSLTSYPINPALAKGLDPVTGIPNGAPVEIYGANPQEPTGFTYLWSVDNDYQLPWHIVATVGYQGSAGRNLIRLVNQNFLYPVNSHLSAVYIPQTDVTSDFHALNTRLRRPLSKGLEIALNYRLAKSVDELSYEGPGADTNQTYPQDLKSEHGPSDFDVRHSIVASGLWQVPFGQNRTGALGAAIGGWQINAIGTFHTGYPWTPKLNKRITEPSGLTLSPIRPVAYFGGALEDTSDNAFIRPGGNFPGGGAKYFDVTTIGPPGIGRNSFRGPRYASLDLSLAKRTRLAKLLGSPASVEVRANFFNALNTLNLAPLRFASTGVFADSANFGLSPGGLAGRVIDLQARISF